MAGDVLVLAEFRNGEVDNVTARLLAKGRVIADALHVQLAVLAVGFNLGTLAGKLKHCGADAVIVAEHPILNDYRPETYSRVVSDMVRRTSPALVLVGGTYRGMELAPAVATLLQGPVATNCVDLDLLDGSFTVVRPMFGGVVQTKVQLKERTPFVVGFQMGALPLMSMSPRDADVIALPVDMGASDALTRLIEILQPPSGGVDITKADVIVSVGRGICDKDNIRLARDLADALGGVVACSRPVADMGWLPSECHVGVSGKTVRPKIYIACGISGASQHLAGMQDTELIIAINKDQQAPIFGVAHYGIVGDLMEVLPVLARRAGLRQ